MSQSADLNVTFTSTSQGHRLAIRKKMMQAASGSVYPLPAVQSGPPATALGPIFNRFSKTNYSTTKFLALQEYCATASLWRVTAVLVLTPVPALIGSVVPSFVPLQNPLLGHEAIPGTLLHCAIMMFLVSFGVIILTLGATATPRHMYSEAEGLMIAVVTSAAIYAVLYIMLTYWRSPMPFGILLTAIPWGICIVLAHAILLRHKFKRYPHLLPSLSRYMMPLQLQTSQFGIYAGLTVLFDRVDTVFQVAMVLVFPLVKFLLKRLMRKYTRALGEMSDEVALSAIEICASLYQSMIMQKTPSTLALCMIMGVDLVQGMVAIKYFMGRHLHTPRSEVFGKATEILSRYQRGGSLNRSKMSEAEALVVAEALELATAVDSVLLVEYFEVSVPMANALFLLLTYRTSSTRYNMRLYNFYENTDAVVASTGSVLLYSALQGVSLVVMHFILKKRYNTLAFHHLAFVLEYHARSIQGKLVGFFPLVFYFTVIHYGADFTLRFDFKALLAEMSPVG